MYCLNMNGCGVYMLKNVKSGKFYIGSSINLLSRRSCHFRDLRRGMHSNDHLQKSYNKHKGQYFVWGIIEYVSKELVREREAYYIETLKPTYNLVQVVDGLFTVSIATREKMSRIRLGKPHTNKGIKRGPLSDEAKMKIAESNRKRMASLTPEARKKYAHNTGKLRPENDRLKIAKGRPEWKPIHIYTLNGQYYKSFDMFKEAAEELHCDPESIGRAVKHNRVLAEKYVVKRSMVPKDVLLFSEIPMRRTDKIWATRRSKKTDFN